MTILRHKCYVCGNKGRSHVKSWVCKSESAKGFRTRVCCYMVWYCPECYKNSEEAKRGRLPDVAVDVLSRL